MNIRGPGEYAGQERFFPVEPGVSAENLIGTFSAQGDGVLFLYQRAEVQKGRVHVGHAGQIPGTQGIMQSFQQDFTGANQPVMIGMQ